MKYLLYRCITVEEPHYRIGLVQCMNCQELGHTKSYFTLIYKITTHFTAVAARAVGCYVIILNKLT